MSIELHELHRRRLEATVSLIEDALNRVERLLNKAGRSGIVRTVEDHLSHEQRTSLLRQVDLFRSELEAFAAHFALERHPLNIQQICNAEMSTAWVMLEDCRPKRMKGYGVAFAPAIAADLEQNVEALLERVRSLRAGLG